MKLDLLRENKLEDKIISGKYVLGIFVTFVVFCALILLRAKFRCVQNIALSIVSIIGGDPDVFSASIRNNTAFLGSAVWTLTTILAAFIVLYYTSMGYKNYGVPNRKIIAYTCGTLFLPGVAALNAIIVVGMTWAYYGKLYTCFYLLCGYSFFLQAILIVVCVWSTSQKRCYDVILKIEDKQFQKLYDIYTECEKGSGNKSIDYDDIERIKKVFVYHMDIVLFGNETPAEQRELIKAILAIPFDEKYKTITKIPECMYSYLYHNIQSIVNNMDCEKDEEKIYDIFYSSIIELQSDTIFEKLGNTRDEMLLIYFGALFNVIVPKESLKKRWIFISYLIQKLIINAELKKCMIVELMMSIHFLWSISEMDALDNEEYIMVETLFSEFTYFKQGKICLEEFHKYAERLTSMLEGWVRSATKDAKVCARIVRDFLMNISDEKNESFISYLYQICIWGDVQ